MIDKLLSLILRETWALDASFVAAYQERVQKFLQGEKIDFSDLTNGDKIRLQAANSLGIFDVENYAGEEDQPDDTVAIISLRGTMLKYSDWCTYGTDEIAAALKDALLADHVKAVILSSHSPGGITSSIFPLKDAMANRTKPVIGLVDDLSASASYYVTSMADKVFAIDDMAQIGSIGAMAVMVRDTRTKEERGYEVVEMYPKESQYKGLPAREALEGKTDRYKEEILSPWAKNFQNHVKAMRGGKLNLKTEGLLEGKLFYAYDAVQNGLIDGIKSLENTIQYALDMADSKLIINQIN